MAATYGKKKATVTGDLLKEMAAMFWEKLPQYARQPKPKFSTVWLEGFKAPNSIKGSGSMAKPEQLI